MTLGEHLSGKSLPQAFSFTSPVGVSRVVIWQKGTDGAYWMSIQTDENPEQTGVMSDEAELGEVTSESLGFMETLRAKLANLVS